MIVVEINIHEIGSYVRLRELFLLLRNSGEDTITLSDTLSTDEIVLELAIKYGINVIFSDLERVAYKEGTQVIRATEDGIMGYIIEQVTKEAPQVFSYEVIPEKPDYIEGVRQMLKGGKRRW